MTIRHISAVVAGALIGLGACSTNPLAVSGDSSQTLALGVGQQLNLTVGTVGPGLYQVNVTVPEGLADGDHPVIASVSGVSSSAGALLKTAVF